MRAIVLAGGKGVRLAPLTEVIPKPLVPIAGMPILEIVIRQLKKYGFRRITLAVGYMADLIQAYFGDGAKWALKIDYSYESEPLGTAGPLSQVKGLDDTFIVMNADVLTDLNYRELVEYHKTSGAIGTVSAYERQVNIDLGVIIKDTHCRIKDYIEKPVFTHLVSMGIYVFEPAILKYIPKSAHMDFPDLVKLLLQDQQLLNYYQFSGYWLDIGRHEDYARASEEFDSLRWELD